MKNPLKSIDDAVMSGVNSGVRAWNWTTGRTKADLANIFVLGGTGTLIGSAAYKHPIIGLLSLAFLYPATSILKRNRRIEKIESDAADSLAQSIEVEFSKRDNKCYGNLFLSCSAIQVMGAYGLYATSSSFDFVGDSVGFLLFGVSYHIMRADYLPPRKNCLSRGYDKFKEKIKNVNPIPTPVPVPIPIDNCLGNYALYLTR